MQEFLQQLVNGVVSGSLYSLIAIGVTLVYGLTNLINFAHGQVVTIGAFTAWSATTSGVPFALAVVIAAIVGGLVSVAMERGGFRFTRANPINGFILSLGLIFVLEGVMVERYADTLHRIPDPTSGVFRAGDVQISYQRLIVVGVALALTGVLMSSLKYTRMGRATRAYAEDPDTAALMGVNTERVIMAVFVVGGALAGVAGSLLLSLFGVTVTLGAAFVVKAFVVVADRRSRQRRRRTDRRHRRRARRDARQCVHLVELDRLLRLRARHHGAARTPLRDLQGLGGCSCLTRSCPPVAGTALDPGTVAAAPRRTPWWRPYLPVVVFVAVLTVLPFIGLSNRHIHLAVVCLIWTIAAYGLFVPYAFAGQMTVAIVTAWGVGAYATGIAIKYWDWTFVPCVLLSIGLGVPRRDDHGAADPQNEGSLLRHHHLRHRRGGHRRRQQLGRHIWRRRGRHVGVAVRSASSASTSANAATCTTCAWPSPRSWRSASRGYGDRGSASTSPPFGRTRSWPGRSAFAPPG